MAKLHPVLRAAGGDGALPDWVRMSPARHAHAERVGKLLWKWGKALDLSKRERRRWRAAGLLHDALKDERPRVLRDLVTEASDWPGPLLHGPACAELLRREGVDDESFLLAISHHTTGHPDFDRLGEALYLADYLEPDRRGMAMRRASWRRRLPDDWEQVLIEVAASKIGTLLDRQVPIPGVTSRFWRRLTA